MKMRHILIFLVGICLLGSGTILSLPLSVDPAQTQVVHHPNYILSLANMQMRNESPAVWSSNCDRGSEWIFGSVNGPQLWHITTRDAWMGNDSLGCFHHQYFNYENNMFLNYALANITLDMRDVIDMMMDFYCKFITEDSDDHWGIVLYDPALNVLLSHRWNALESWQKLTYETYGYHPEWMGPMQPIDHYESFNIKAAYDHWYEKGYFRHPQNGSKSYEVQVGFMMYETDVSGYTNAEAEANGVYWSGVFIDDVTIKQLIINHPPYTPSKPDGPLNGQRNVTISFSTHSIDPDGDMIRYGWDWNNDDIVDEWTSYYDSGVTIQRSQFWSELGLYHIKVLAEDEHGEKSAFSTPASILISENAGPMIPDRPSGPSTGKIGVSYSYETQSTDPNSDVIYYLFDWGDGTDSGWIGPYDSGDTISLSYTWIKKGSYDIKVKAIDDPNHDGDLSDGIESDWSEPLAIRMPKTNNHYLIFQRILTRIQSWNCQCHFVG